MSNQLKSKLELRIPPIALVIICMAAMFVMRHLYVSRYFEFNGNVFITVVLCGLGIGLAGSGVMNFIANHTTVDPTAPQEASSLVTSGIYKMTRNPMYLGFVMLLGAWLIYLGNALNIIWIVGFVWMLNELQIKPEEKALLAIFGQEYEDYCKRVRRWL